MYSYFIHKVKTTVCEISGNDIWVHFSQDRNFRFTLTYRAHWPTQPVISCTDVTPRIYRCKL